MVLPDTFIEHGKPDAMYEQAGLTATGIVTTVLGALGRETLDDAASRA
jgi:1-deoxy-D-xylulose-5-phosphate synthase